MKTVPRYPQRWGRGCLCRWRNRRLMSGDGGWVYCARCLRPLTVTGMKEARRFGLVGLDREAMVFEVVADGVLR